MLDPMVVILEIDDVGVILSVLPRARHATVLRREEVDDRVREPDAFRTIRALGFRSPQYLRIKTLGPFNV
jgi:hypothetical protein